MTTEDLVAEARFFYDPAAPVDPLGDAEQEAEKGTKHNRAKVGSGRPSSLLYTYGPGAIMDLPQFTVMLAGLDDWDRIWRRRDDIPQIRAPRRPWSGCARSTRWSGSPASTTWTGSGTCPAGSPR